MPLPETLFGGRSIGTTLTTASEVQKVLDQLKEFHIDHIDTAASWPNTRPGRSEALLGEVQALEQGFNVDTRIDSTTKSSSVPRGARTLTGPAIERSLEKSLDHLRTKKVNVLYLHRQDQSTPIDQQAAAIHEQYLEGRFEKVPELFLFYKQ